MQGSQGWNCMLIGKGCDAKLAQKMPKSECVTNQPADQLTDKNLGALKYKIASTDTEFRNKLWLLEITDC